MANNVTPNHAPDFLGGTVDVEVTGPLIGRSIFDGLLGNFSTSGQMEEGDYNMDRSRELLRRHLQLMNVDEQDTIRQKFDDLRNRRNRLDSFSGSALEKYRKARAYRRVSRVTYRIVKRASERGIEDRLMDQIAEELQRHGGGSGSGGTGPVASIPGNPDSHAVSTLTDVTVDDLDRVEMSTYVDGDSGEGAVVLDFVNRDQSAQHVVATFPVEAFSGDRTDRGVPGASVAMSLHQEDGTTPRLITASPPDVSQYHSSDEEDEVETGTIHSTDGLLSSKSTPQGSSRKTSRKQLLKMFNNFNPLKDVSPA